MRSVPSPSASSPALTLPVTNFGYQYDAAGNRTQKSTLDYTEDYGYDPLYRLTRADRTNPGAVPPNQWTWNYDAVGNRTSAQKDQEATTSTHNEKNQLLQTTGGGKMLWRGTLSEPGTTTFNAASASINGQPARMLAGNVFEATLDLPAGANTVTIQAQDGSGNVSSKSYSVNVLGVPATYTYDANGNLATKTEGADAWVYTWNALNQLTAVTKNGAAVATYQYDAQGRRVQGGAGASTTTWAYDGENILRASSGIASLKYVHGPDADAPLAHEGTALTFIHADGLGSVIATTTPSGAVAGSNQYDAWGNVSGSVAGGYAFTGRELDAETSLLYYRARYMDSKAGRFINEDPLPFVGGPNAFAYVWNDPVGITDPSGMAPAASPRTMLTCGQALLVTAKIWRLVNRGRVPDKIGHCLAHCYLSRSCSEKLSVVGGGTKEALDAAEGGLTFFITIGSGGMIAPNNPTFNPTKKWDPQDMKANAHGRTCPATESCWDRCKDAQNMFP